MFDSVVLDVEARAQAILTGSDEPALRQVTVKQIGRHLELTGTVTSFYHKQLAQEALRGMVDGCQVVNRLEVR